MCLPGLGAVVFEPRGGPVVAEGDLGASWLLLDLPAPEVHPGGLLEEEGEAAALIRVLELPELQGDRGLVGVEGGGQSLELLSVVRREEVAGGGDEEDGAGVCVGALRLLQLVALVEGVANLLQLGVSLQMIAKAAGWSLRIGFRSVSG